MSTDSSAIADVVRAVDKSVRIIDRPGRFATDNSSTEEVMLHFASLVDFDLLVTIQATSPMLKPSELSSGIEQFRLGKFDSMLSAVRTKRFYWSDSGVPLNYDPNHRPRRQEFRGTLMENGAFYITSREVLLRDRNRLGGRVGIFEMESDSAVEIDEPEDWETVERLLNLRSRRQS